MPTAKGWQINTEREKKKAGFICSYVRLFALSPEQDLEPQISRKTTQRDEANPLFEFGFLLKNLCQNTFSLSDFPAQ